MERKKHTIDAEGKSIGRLATGIAVILRGKNKPEFDPSKDIGDVVEVVNIDKVRFTGEKLEQKKYYKYSGYPGGLKETKMIKLKESRVDGAAEILRRAVKEMLPPVRFRQAMIKRLVIR